MYSWGEINKVYKIHRGLSWLSCSGHGGFRVSKVYAEKNLSLAALKRGLWEGNYIYFEEDCASYIIMLEIRTACTSEAFGNAPTYEEIIKSLSRNYADYLVEKGIEPEPEAYKEYLQWEEHQERRANKDPDLIVCARGEWHTKIEGVVEVITADDRKHLVTADSYHKRSGLNLLSKCVKVGTYMEDTPGVV
jgi:hypothetical protein